MQNRSSFSQKLNQGAFFFNRTLKPASWLTDPAMSFKSIVRDFRRSSLAHHREPAAAWAEVEEDDRKKQGKWANMPPELLMDILKRVDAGQVSWPARRNVVACAAVCRSWREIMKELISSPQISGRITFPISLKMPGPRDSVIQCFIKRERATSTYRLYHGLSPALQEKGDKLLLAARKVRRAASSHFVISLAPDEFSRASCTYVGKLKSNFLGSKFTIYDSQPPGRDAPSSSSSRSNRRFHAKQVSPRLPIGNYSTGSIAYELNVLRGRGPRRMLVTMHSIPVSALQDFDHFFPTASLKKEKDPAADFSCSSLNSEAEMRREPLILKNKAPRWHEQLQCWCLNFKGRVTVASVKNFQLVAMIDPSEQEKVVIQFGKIGKDIFTMDYRYPLSAFQAFAICLSSFDTKPACE